MSIKEEHLEFYKPKKLGEHGAQNQQPSLFDFEPQLLESSKNTSEREKPKPSKKALIKIEHPEVNKFFAENKISITTDTVQNKLKEIIGMFQNEFEDYLVFLINYAKQEAEKKPITSISGFYIGLLKDDSQLNNYIFSIQKQRENEQARKNKLKLLVENELETRYEKFLYGDFEKYLEKNIDKLEAKMVKLIKSTLKSGDFLYDAVIVRSHGGNIDRSLIIGSKPSVKVSITGYLGSYKDELGYKAVSFEAWKKKLVTAEYLRELEAEILDSI